MVSVNFFDTTSRAASVTPYVTVLEPGDLGVPEILLEDAVNDSPSGRFVTQYVYGLTPPDADGSVVENALLNLPVLSDTDGSFKGGVGVGVGGAVTVTSCESLALPTLTLTVPVPSLHPHKVKENEYS